MVPKTTRPRHFGLKEHKPHTLKQIFQEWQKFAGFDIKHPISMPAYTYLVFYASESPGWRELLTGTRQFKENGEIEGTRYNAPHSVASFMRYYWTFQSRSSF